MPRNIDGHGCLMIRKPPSLGPHGVPSFLTTCGVDTEERPRAAPWLGRRDARNRRHHDGAGLRLPPGVDDRAAAAADDLVVPHPRLGIDRLADAAQQPQRRQIVRLRVLVAPAHEGADRGRRRVEDRHLPPFDDRPEAILARVIGRAFVDDAGGAVGQRPVDDVAVAGHPADVGRAPEDVVVVQIEHVLRRQVRAQQEAARRVHDPLGLPGRAGRVQDEQRVLGRQARRRAVGGRAAPSLRPTTRRGRPASRRRRLFAWRRCTP